MFRLIADPEFSTTVTVLMPSAPAPEEQSFTARFRALPVSELPDVATLDRKGVSDLIRSVMVDWEGVVDEAGKAVPFGDDALDAMLDIAAARVPILTAFLRGLTPAARGN